MRIGLRRGRWRCRQGGPMLRSAPHAERADPHHAVVRGARSAGFPGCACGPRRRRRGLAGLAWHPPGSPSRAELTYAGDAELGARLDIARADLEVIAGDVEALAAEARARSRRSPAPTPPASRQASNRAT